MANPSARRILVVSRYEIRRALARRKVLAGVILVVLVQILGIYSYSEINRVVSMIDLPVKPDLGLAWLFTYFLPSYLMSGPRVSQSLWILLRGVRGENI